MEEFFIILDLLSEKGIIPLALGDNGIWTSTHLFESLLLAELGPNHYMELWSNPDLWGSSGVRNAVETFLHILKYVNTDHAALTWEDAARYVAEGRAAMNIMGDWSDGFYLSKGYEPGTDFGWVPTPGTEGVFMMLSDTFGLPKDAPFKDNAVKWLRLIISRQGQDIFNPMKGSIPSRMDCDRELYDIYIQSAMEEFQTNIIVPSVCHGAAASETWINEINRIISTLIIERNVDDAVRLLQNISGAVLKK
jgi:glucose/mannose transport system substrate-binding protein